MRDCKEKQVLAETMGSYPGIGEEAEVSMEEQGAGEVSPSGQRWRRL